MSDPEAMGQRLVEDHETRKGQTSLMKQIDASDFQRG